MKVTILEDDCREVNFHNIRTLNLSNLEYN